MSKHTPNYEIHILMGLPGSGKTHYTRQVKRESSNASRVIIDLDKHISDKLDMLDSLRVELYDNHVARIGRYDYYRTDQNIYIDGLILTRDNLKKTIKTCVDYIKEQCGENHTLKIIVHIWDNDRETCINNDKYRLELNERCYSSEISIKNLQFDMIDGGGLHSIMDELGLGHIQKDVIEHEIYKMSNYDTLLKPYSNCWKDENVLESESWSKGGDWCNCWGNSGTISPDPTPEFKEFDDLLTDICPNITFLQYKKLYSECVREEEYKEYDYYGGCEYHGKWVCDLKQLYEMLIEMKLIEI